MALAGVALSLAVWAQGWLSNLSRFWWKQLPKQHVTCSSVSGYHCYLVESELGVLVGCSFRSANFLPTWCLQSVSAWCNWIGCYFRLVILAFAGRLDWTWYYCFSKNIFGLKTEGQQFANAEFEANSVVCLMPLGQQRCSPDRLICNKMKPRTATARQDSISPHSLLQPVLLSRSPFFLLYCLSSPWFYISLLGVYLFPSPCLFP